MKLQRLICENEHDFFIKFNFPMPVMDFVEMTSNIVCPLCHSDKIRLDANAFELTENDKEDADESV